MGRIGRLYRLEKPPVLKRRIGRLYPLRMAGRSARGFKGEAEGKD